MKTVRPSNNLIKLVQTGVGYCVETLYSNPVDSIDNNVHNYNDT